MLYKNRYCRTKLDNIRASKIAKIDINIEFIYQDF